MGKECLWKKAYKVRKIIKDRRTTITKSRNGNTVGGIALDDDTIKPYMKQLADIEAQLKKDKDAMSTKERVDDAAKEVMADAAQNKEDITTTIQDCFAKAFPKKFAKIHKWAYVRPSSGSAGEAPSRDKIKVRVDEYMDRELDLYKYYDTDGNVACAPGSALEWITRVEQTVQLKEHLPKHLRPWRGMKGIVAAEPPATKPESPKDVFEVTMADGKMRKVRREFLIFDDEEGDLEDGDWEEGKVCVVPPARDDEERKEERDEKTPREERDKKTPREEKKEKTPREEKKEKTPREEKTEKNSDDPTPVAIDSRAWGKPVRVQWLDNVTDVEKSTMKDIIEDVTGILDKPKMKNEIARELRSLNKDREKRGKPFVAKWYDPQGLVIIECRQRRGAVCVVWTQPHSRQSSVSASHD